MLKIIFLMQSNTFSSSISPSVTFCNTNEKGGWGGSYRPCLKLLRECCNNLPRKIIILYPLYFFSNAEAKSELLEAIRGHQEFLTDPEKNQGRLTKEDKVKLKTTTYNIYKKS